MIAVALFLIWIWGYSLISLLGKGFNLPLKAGLSMLLGLGLVSVAMFLYDLVHIPITLYSVLGLAFVSSLLAFFKIKSICLDDFKELKSTDFAISRINFTWVFFLGILLYLTYGIYKKSVYWPVTEYDSVTGYDFMAKMIAAEGKLNVSIFDYSTNALAMARFIYPPIVATSYSIPYLCGMELSRIMPVVFFVSLLFGFYGVIRQYTTHTAAIIVTVLMAVAPEMFSHAALSLTNLPNAAYASLAVITFFVWTREKTRPWLLLSAVTMAFTLFSRSDSIVFAAATLLVMFWYSIREKSFKDLFLYGTISLSLFAAWMLYLKVVIHSSSSDFFVKELFWDGEKLDKILGYVMDFMVWETQFYGVTFWMFFLLLAINIKHLKTDLTTFLAASILAWLSYTFLYYQMDYKVASLDMFMKASYKRGMFCFVPLAWYYVATNKASVWFFAKLDSFLYR